MKTCAFALLTLGWFSGAWADDLVVFGAPEQRPAEQLTRYLNRIGREQLAARDREIAAIRSRADAERRKTLVREKVLRLIGGLPDYRGPLNAKSLGVLDRGDYRIEKVIYESLPGVFVPANVYVPAKGSGPFPAVLMPVGHGDEGKAAGQRQIAVGLARKGFVALMYDPISQGERIQYYDPDLRASKVGGSTDEHTHANGQAALIGDNVARYRIWDGMRGIDYLVSRKDVDAARIGCTGCSGGGTLTTYISALDDRVKVAVPACYINSWEELLAGPGPQDGEQTFAGFLSEGLNIADYLEAFAPKPLMIASTIQDFFPLEGARQAYEEARRIYSLYGAAERIGWHIGPGGHGVPAPSRQAIYAWFIKWLQNGEGDPAEALVTLDPQEALLCTATGQVADSLGGETVFTLNKKRAADVIPPKASIARAADAERLRARLASDIRALAGITLRPAGQPPRFTFHRSLTGEGYRLDVISIESERGIELPGLMLAPETAGPKPAVLVVEARPKQAILADLEALARAGHLVLAIQPRGVPETPSSGRPSLVGGYSPAFRALVVGKTLAGMRAEDIIRALDYLSSRPDVDRARIGAFAQGAMAVPLLHAAVLDERIGALVLQQPLATYRMAVDRPIHRNLYEVAIPGVLRKYDLDDLLVALSPRAVTVLNPVDALGRPLSQAAYREACRFIFDSNAKLGQPDRVRVALRGAQDRLVEFFNP